MADRSESVELALGGLAYTGWKRIEIARSLDALAGSFTLEAAARGDGDDEDFTFEAGAACHVRVGGETLIAGFIDQFSPGYDKDAHEISISGRDRAGDLADCSAIHQPGSWINSKIETIAAAIAAPYGITVTAEADTGAALKKFAIQQGESVHDAIERMLRFRGLILQARADGSVAITAAASGRASVSIPLHRVLRAAALHDVSGRYSSYVVKGQASGDEDAHGRAVAAITAVARDPAVKRVRTLVIIAEDQGDRASLDRRARWEATVRAGRSQEATITVQGWRDEAGALFAPNTLVQFEDPRLRMAGTLLMTAVTLRQDDEGTTAELKLSPPEAWSQMAVPETREASRVG